MEEAVVGLSDELNDIRTEQHENAQALTNRIDQQQEDFHRITDRLETAELTTEQNSAELHTRIHVVEGMCSYTPISLLQLH